MREGEPARLTWVNPSFCRLFDYTAEEIQAMPEPDLWALVHPDDREAARRSITQQFTEWFDTSRLRLRVLTKAGECRWVDGTGRLVRGSNDRMIMFMLRDVTEEQETRALLESAKAHAEDASRAKAIPGQPEATRYARGINGIVGMSSCSSSAAWDTEDGGYVQMALQASQTPTGCCPTPGPLAHRGGQMPLSRTFECGRPFSKSGSSPALGQQSGTTAAVRRSRLTGS